MYKKSHYILFAFIQALMSSLVFFYLPFERSKNAILLYLLEVPGWLIITSLKMPKREKENEKAWRERFIFCFFLGMETVSSF